MERKEEFSQTDGPERKDFQVQATVQQGQPIFTQTDSSIKCDFQAQADISRENDSIAVQTIKEEIAMPNLTSSVAPSPAKKRKMSAVSTSGSTSTNTAAIDLTMPQNQQADVRLNSDRLNNKQVALDDAISESEVYKIYCRNEDPKVAMKQIKELKTCLDFQQPTQPFPAEEDFKRVCGETLKKLWEMEPWRKSTKFGQIKRYIDVSTDRGHTGYGLHWLGFEMYKILNTCFTRIQIVIPNGHVGMLQILKRA